MEWRLIPGTGAVAPMQESAEARLLPGTGAVLMDPAEGGTETPKAVADTVALTESLARQVQKVSGLAETVALTEALARVTGRPLAETVQLAESLAKQPARTIAETLGLTEDQTVQVGKALAETVVLEEALARLVATARAETVDLTEDQTVQVNKVLGETVGFVENLGAQVVRLKDLAETVGLTEAQVRQVGKQLGDALGLAEALVRRLARGHAETVSLVEQLTASLVGGLVAGLERFRIVGSLEAPAMAFSADLADLGLYLAPDEATRLLLEIGLLTAGGSEVLCAQLRDGVILERALVGTADSVVCRVTGRNAMDAALRTQVNRRYVLNWRPQPVATLGASETPQDVEEKAGDWTAQGIAADLAAEAGLALHWGVGPYRMRDTFDAQGTVYDLVRQLAAPWDHPLAEPFRVDVYAQDGILYVTQAGVSLVADTTLSVAESRLTPAGPRRTRLPLLGRVEIEGMDVSDYLTEETDPVTGVVTYRGGDDPEAEDVNRQPLTLVTTRHVTDKHGERIGTIETTTTYRMPERLPEHITQRTWQRGDASKPWKQTAYLETVNTWEPSALGPRGLVNQPQLLGSESRKWTLQTIQRLVHVQTPASSPTPSGPAAVSTEELVETEREVHGVTLHPVLRFVTAEERKKSRQTVLTPPANSPLASSTLSGFKPAESESRSYDPHVLPGWTLVTTTRTVYDQDGKPTSSTVDPQWISGLPPGGIRPPLPRGGASSVTAGGVEQATEADAGALQPVRLVQTISADPTAIPVRVKVLHFGLAECQRLMAQFVASSGKYRYVQEAAGPVVPWLALARVLHLTDYTAADGTTAIPLAPAQIRDLDVAYDEPPDQPGEARCRLLLRWYAAS